MSTKEVVNKTIKNENLSDIQNVYSGGIVSEIKIRNNGSQNVYSNGFAYNTIIYSGGNQFAYSKAVVSGNTIKNGGIQNISNGGYAYSTIIESGGSQKITYYGNASNTTIKNGGVQIVSGYSYNTTINNNGSQFVYKEAENTTINSGGKQIVSGGYVINTTVKNGGTLTFDYYTNVAKNIKIQSGGNLNIGDVTIEDITAGKGANISAGSFNLSGYNNKLSNVEIKSYNNYSRDIYLKNSTNLTLSGNVDLSKFSINSGTVNFYGQNNKIYEYGGHFSIFHLEKINKTNSKYSVSCEYMPSNIFGSTSISVAKNQKIGTYNIIKNCRLDESHRYKILIDNKTVSENFINEKINKNGITYSSIFKDNNLKLKISVYGEKIHKGTSKSDPLTGTKNSDIFYGGKGNDTITGMDGRDVVVYDKTSWGKDVIQKTDGTITVLIKDLKSKDIKTTLNSNKKVMTITRSNDSNQKITINGWDDSTHEIVYGGSIKSFDSYLKTSNPTADITSAARSEVLKKAGLAS